MYSEGVTNMNSICLNTQKRCRWEKKKSFIFTNAIKNPGFLCVCVCKTTIETTTFGYNLFFNLFQHRQKRGQWPRQNMYIVFFICSISEDIQLLSKYQLHRSDFFFFLNMIPLSYVLEIYWWQERLPLTQYLLTIKSDNMIYHNLSPLSESTFT